MTHSTIPRVLRGLALIPLALACSSSPTGPGYDPDIPTQWAASVTNPLFPLTPGTVLEYSSDTPDGFETITVEVLTAGRMVNGVAAVAVHDQVFLDGELIENTYDWYAQDLDGNVWYLGEDTQELEGGVVVGTSGSWEWNVDGALPGIYVWADPAAHIGEEYRQEYYADEAEDWAVVVAVNETITVPFGTLTGCLRTEDWNGLEGRADTAEYKYYCPGVGISLEVSVADPTLRLELEDRIDP
jgi:hypothetical protein